MWRRAPPRDAYLPGQVPTLFQNPEITPSFVGLSSYLKVLTVGFHDLCQPTGVGILLQMLQFAP